MSSLTDGSKLGGKVLAVSSQNTGIFQAEATALKVAADALLRSAVSFREVSIYSDSRALSSLTVHSRLVKKCLSSL